MWTRQNYFKWIIASKTIGRHLDLCERRLDWELLRNLNATEYNDYAK